MTEITIGDVCRSAFDDAIEAIRRAKNSREEGPVSSRLLYSEMNPIFSFGGNDFNLETAGDLTEIAWHEARSAVRNILLSASILTEKSYIAPANRYEPFALLEINGWTGYVICGSAEDRQFLTPLVEGAKQQRKAPCWKKVRLFRRISLYDPKDVFKWYGNPKARDDSSGYSPNLETITLRDFFKTHFSADDFETFLSEARRYVEAARGIIGYRTVPVPTNEFLRRFKMNLVEGLEKDTKSFALELERDGLKNDQVEIMVKNFVERRRLMALVGTLPFADSFVSSEWFYTVDHKTDALEKTGVVSGYLKSIEQLLRHLTDLAKDEGREISLWKGSDPIPLSSDCDEADKRNLGALQYFLSDNTNRDLFCISNRSRRLLINKLGRWRDDNRNGLFHFDNIHDEGKVDEIRRQTRFLYFLILGGWRREDPAALGMSLENDEQSEPNFNEDLFRRWLENGLAPLAARYWILDKAATIRLYYFIDRNWWCTDHRENGIKKERHWEMLLEICGPDSSNLFDGPPPLYTTKEGYRWVSDDEEILGDMNRARLLASQMLRDSPLFMRRNCPPDLHIFDLDVEAARAIKTNPELFPSSSFKNKRTSRQVPQ